MTLQELQEITECTVTENNKILINPMDKHSFAAFPLDLEKPTLEVSLDEYIGLIFGKYEFSDDLSSIIESPRDEFSEEQENGDQNPENLSEN